MYSVRAAYVVLMDLVGLKVISFIFSDLSEKVPEAQTYTNGETDRQQRQKQTEADGGTDGERIKYIKGQM